LDQFTLDLCRADKIKIGFDLLPYIRPRLRSVDLRTIHNVDVMVTIGGEGDEKLVQSEMFDAIEGEIAQ